METPPSEATPPAGNGGAEPPAGNVPPENQNAQGDDPQAGAPQQGAPADGSQPPAGAPEGGDGNPDPGGEQPGGQPRRPDKRTRAISKLQESNQEVLAQNERYRDLLRRRGIDPDKQTQEPPKDLAKELGLEPGKTYDLADIADLVDKRASEKASQGIGSQVEVAVAKHLQERDRTTNLDNDIAEVQKTYDELNPESGGYDEDLDDLIAEAFRDARTRNPDVRLRDVAQRQIDIIRKKSTKAAADSSKNLEKKAGSGVLTPTGGDRTETPVDENSMSAAEYAAHHGIKKVSG